MQNSGDQVIINIDRYYYLLEMEKLEKGLSNSFVAIPLKINEWDSKYYKFYNPDNNEELKEIKEHFAQTSSRISDLVRLTEDHNLTINSLTWEKEGIKTELDNIKSKWWYKLFSSK